MRRSSILTGEPQTSFFNRLCAKGIDALFAGAIFLIGATFWPPAGPALALLYAVFHDAIGDGRSIGKRIMGLCVLDAETGVPCGFPQSAVRNIPFALVILFSISAWLWVFLLLIAIPLVILEIYLLQHIDSGSRVGDVLANTLAAEAHQELTPDAA